MVDTLELDWESKGRIDLRNKGFDRYRSHRETKVLMGAYAINGGGFKHWEAHKRPIPNELREALLDPHVEKWAFNAQFERVMTRDVLNIPTPIAGWRCTQVLAGLQAFNGSLDEVGERIGLKPDLQKSKAGRRLIQRFSVPQRITKANPYEWHDWNTHPDEWEEFCRYNIQDCVTERATRNRLIKYPVPAEEWELYELDQEINDRGMPVDLVFVENAIRMSEARKAELTEQMSDICHLANPGSIRQLLPWLKAEGYWFEDLNQDTCAKALAIDKESPDPRLSDDAKAILRLREWQARLSTRKYNSIMDRVGEDGWLRYSLQMAGAGRTARWAGRGVQTQNLKTTPPALEAPGVLESVNAIIRSGDYEALKNYTALSEFVEEPMEALTGCVRSSFRAPEGYELVVSDLKSIETAMIGWLTKCQWILSIFRKGEDPYRAFAVVFFQILYEEVTRAQRKFCKPGMLGCGYRLGGGELKGGKRTGLWGYAESFGVDMPKKDAHRAVEVYRAQASEVTEHWKEYEKAIRKTLQDNEDQWVGTIRFEHRKPYLLAWLPTGRPIFFFLPVLKHRTVDTGRMKKIPSQGMFEHGVPKGQNVDVPDTFNTLSFTYMGMDQVTHKWQRRDSHGGVVIEQLTQGASREVLKRGLLKAAAWGFPIISHSHDEIITCVKKGSNWLTLKNLIWCMTRPLPEMPGLPLGAAGYTNDFYYKD